jgi:hypothetical protein
MPVQVQVDPALVPVLAHALDLADRLVPASVRVLAPAAQLLPVKRPVRNVPLPSRRKAQ